MARERGDREQASGAGHGREQGNRPGGGDPASESSQFPGRAAAGDPVPSRLLVSRWYGTERNSSPPNTDISAGVSVIDTTIAVSTVSASAGPKSRSDWFLATISAAVLAATMRPAARMIGANSAVACRAAWTRCTPSASLARMPDRKNTE